jgi:hypothetical protein
MRPLLPPIPEILRGRLDGNNKAQFEALRAWERRAEAGEWDPPQQRYVVEVPIAGSRFYEVMATDSEDAEILIADGEGTLMEDDVEEMRDFGTAQLARGKS